jgi:hypothetical protein
MCFSSGTVDDPTQGPITRTASVFSSRKVNDPTQQAIHITQSNEAHASESPTQQAKMRKHSYKDRAAFVDVTDQEHKPMEKRNSKVDTATLAASPPKRNPNKNWKGRSTNPATFGLGFGADFSAGPM